MIVTICQLNIAWEDKEVNFAAVRNLLASSSPKPGSLVILPEMFATGFSMDVARIADDDRRVTELFLAEIAQTYQAFVLGGFVTKTQEGKGRNEAALFSPEGSELCRYCKMHPFTYAGEADHFIAGNQVIACRCDDAMITPFICYDLRFPEVFRQAIRLGTQVFIVIANWPQQRSKHWEILLMARAIENQAYVIGVNRCGADPFHQYRGHSMVIDPLGNPIAHSGETEGTLECSLDMPALVAYRAAFPVLSDMRSE